MANDRVTIEEFTDWYVENSFAVRDAEVQFRLQIGEMLQDIPEEQLKLYASAIHRHTSFLKECIEVYKHWNELEKEYTKDKSWTDFVKMVGLEKEKRPRKSFKSILQERAEKNEEVFKQTQDPEVRGRMKEDLELLQGEKEADNK